MSSFLLNPVKQLLNNLIAKERDRLSFDKDLSNKLTQSLLLCRTLLEKFDHIPKDHPKRIEAHYNTVDHIFTITDILSKIVHNGDAVLITTNKEEVYRFYSKSERGRIAASFNLQELMADYNQIKSIQVEEKV